MKHLGFVAHKGQQILRIDFSNLGADEMLKAIDEAKGVIASQPPASVLTMTVATNCTYNSVINKALREYTAHNKPFVRAAAVVGATGLRKALLYTVATLSGRDFAPKDSEEEALEWLIKF